MTPRPTTFPDTLRLLALLALGAVACQRAAPPSAEPVRVDNPTLGVALTEVPEPFRLESNSPEGLVLSAGPGTRVEFAVSEPEGGVNVVAAAQASQREFAALPDGRFDGGTELVTPFGSAYTVRGSFDDGGARLEERRVYLPHPDGGGRQLTIRFRYPAGDVAAARERLQQVLSLVAALGPDTTTGEPG